MKPVARVIDQVSTIEGEKIAMSIDTSAFAHIMSVLTDLYSDPELAVLREYSTNAYDAHVESGVKRPIEVTLPTQLSLTLKIRDYGEGLDRDDIAEIYSQYGASTKRGSDDVVGMLGLGCKSALTYTDQFTVTGWKNGICTQISVSRDENGAGSMTILDQYESDEPSGVEISVPAKTYHKFEQKANEFFMFWSVGTVLVNGETPNRVEDGIWLSDKVLLTQDKRVTESVVVMGNVAYPLEDEEHTFVYGQYGRHYRVVAFVEIGEVNFVPSREALMNTPQTKATVSNLKDTIKNELTRVLTERIQRASSRLNAIKALFEARGLINLPQIKWNGHVIPTKFEGKFVLLDVDTRYDGYYRRSKGWSAYNEISSNTDNLWITDYKVLTCTPHKRKKVEQWLRNKGMNDVKGVIFTDELPKYSSWIDKKKIFSWDEIKDTVVDSNVVRGGGTSRLTGSYDLITSVGRSIGIPADDISQIVPDELYWITPLTKAEINSRYNRRWYRHSDEYDPDGISNRHLFFELRPNSTVVLLPSNRVEKFKRDFPHAKNMTEWLKETANKWEKSLKAPDRLSYYLQTHDEYHDLRGLDEAKINDPYLKRLVKATKRDVDVIRERAKKFSGFIKIETKDVMDKCPYVKYPLLRKLDLTDGDESAKVHISLYVNAAHAAERNTNGS